MKKWEYMFATFIDGRLFMLNGKKVENFELAKWPIFFANLRDSVPTQGIHIVDFLSEAGKDGWEAAVPYGQHGDNIIFKRELEVK